MLLVPVILVGAVGFQHGFLREALSIVITIAALLISVNKWHWASSVIATFVPPADPSHSIVCGVALFVLIMSVCSLIAAFFLRLVKMSLLSIPNRIAGLGFGVLKGAVLVSLFLQLLLPAGIPDSRTRDGSALYPYILPLGPVVYDSLMAAVPGAQSFAEKVGTVLEDLKDYDPTSR